MNKELTSIQRDELIEQFVELVVDNYDEELYDELVDNVTQQYPKQLNSFGG